MSNTFVPAYFVLWPAILAAATMVIILLIAAYKDRQICSLWRDIHTLEQKLRDSSAQLNIARKAIIKLNGELAAARRERDPRIADIERAFESSRIASQENPKPNQQ